MFLGCEGSAGVLPAHLLVLNQYKLWKKGRLAPVIFFYVCCIPDSPFKSMCIMFVDRGKPNRDGEAQDRLDDDPEAG